MNWLFQILIVFCKISIRIQDILSIYAIEGFVISVFSDFGITNSATWNNDGLKFVISNSEIRDNDFFFKFIIMDSKICNFVKTDSKICYNGF